MNLRAAVCKYRPGVGKIKILTNPKKNSVDYPRCLSNENIKLAIPASPQQNSADQAQFALILKGIGNKNSLFYRHFHLVPGVFEFDHSKFQMDRDLSCG